jgi:hypothetical protein
MTQFFWNSYKRLEKEVLSLAEVIHISDDQLGVYSPKIGDLLVRTAIECEALSKELYHANGGTKPNGKDLYFDTDCFGLLEEKWRISKKKILVTSPYVYFLNEENRVLNPLHKANKRGSSSSNWQKAYQAVKHDRVKSLKSGNIGNLLLAMGALYILNIYYRNDNFPVVADRKASDIDWGLGSELFAVKVSSESNGASCRAIYEKKKDYDECIYFVKHTDQTGQAFIDLFAKIEKQVTEETIKNTIQIINEKIKSEDNLSSFEEQIHTIADEQNKKVYNRILQRQGKSLANALQAFKFEAVLNKQQY